MLLSAVYLLHTRLPIGIILIGGPPVSLAAAWIFNRWIEDPSADLGRRITRGRVPAAPGTTS